MRQDVTASGPQEVAAAEAAIARGQGLEDAGDLARAEGCFREAVTAAPRHARAHMNLGNALHKQGRLEEAATAHRTAIACDARSVGAHFNLGMVLLASGQLDEAQAAFERVLELDPRVADAAVSLATLHGQRQDVAAARRELERALTIAPGHAGARANLAVLLMERGELVAAEREFDLALAHDPRSAVALAGRARISVLRGRADLADAGYRAALALDPDSVDTWSAFLFSLNLHDRFDAAQVAREHFALGDRLASLRAPGAGTRRAGGPLRVGFVSADLGQHPVALFLRPFLAHRDKARFHVTCYHNAHAEDDVTQALRRDSDAWRSIAGRGDDWVAARVREDAIDLLVDLSGHTANHRLTLFARKPAPVQATWLGYLNTTGLAAIDYRICDAHTDPPGATEALNRERLARMPHTQWCYWPYYDIALPPPRDARDIVFGSFNQFVKVSESTLDLWCEVLRAVPASRIRIHAVAPGVGLGDVAPRFETRGVAADRVELRGRAGIREYFAAIAATDIALDTFPYNGATTTLDTLWMGTPVVGLRGDRAISRGAFSILRAAGLDELVAASPAEYVAMNIALARDRAARGRVRATLRERLERSPVMDAGGFAADLGALFERMVLEAS